MEEYTCTECSKHMNSMEEVAKHLRRNKTKCNYVDVRASVGGPGRADNHNHVWYCFSCEKDWKDHRSFNSSKALFQHLKDCHEDKIKRGHLYCECEYGYCYDDEICGSCNLKL